MFENGFKAIMLIKHVNESERNHVNVYSGVKKERNSNHLLAKNVWKWF